MSDQTHAIDLTQEEQEELRENYPDRWERLKNADPMTKAWVRMWKAQRANEWPTDEPQRQAKDIQEEVAKAGPDQENFLGWFGFPTDLTRCSPFFPLRHNEIGHRDFLQDYLITSAGWGEIRYTGPRLTTYDEDVLMVLLAILDKAGQARETTEEEGRKTYTYRGPALPLLRLLGYARPGRDAYKRIIAALERLTVAGVKLSIAAGKTKAGKKRPPRKTYMSAMLAGAFWDEDKKELSATVNPFFYEAFCSGSVSILDVAKRISLKGNVAKALYRFVQSHRKDIVFEGHFLTLADTLNMDREQPGFKIRQNLKAAITELTRQKILSKKSKFIAQDIVLLERTNEALPRTESKKKKIAK
jgi:hypothetical protein